MNLNTVTGLRLSNTDRGKLVAFRSKVNDAIEGSEILYNPDLKKYFLFVSYDWLEDNYNVRVGRSDKPEGPYYDIKGNDMAAIGDDYPMITAQYKFSNHSGWQGVGHCGLLRDGSNYFFVSQGRLGSNKYLMDLHVRKMVFTPSGWPVVSPERYAGLHQDTIVRNDLIGKWEHISLSDITTKNESIQVQFLNDGTISGMIGSSWSFDGITLTLNLSDGKTYQARAFREWDWENRKVTIVYTGMNSDGLCVWGKKTES